MHWGKRGAGSPSRRRREAFRPSNEPLEDRRLLTTFDLTTTQTAPLGVELIGKSSNNTAGFKVTDVGNVTGSGYDSFVVSAPGLPFAGVGGRPNFAAANESAAYLVLGSKQVNLNGVANYLTLANGTTNGTTNSLTGGKRAGDLGELGTTGVGLQSGTIAPTAQTNPTVAQPQPPADSTHVYGFNYDGLTLVTGLDALTGLGRNSALGFSVSPLGDLNGDGFDDFAISAPNDSGGGKVFIVFGGTALATQPTTGKTVDLEPTVGINNTATPTKVITLSIPNGATGTDVGYSVSGIGNYFNTSTGRDLAIGVPGLSVGANANAGAVFALSGTYLSSLASGTNVDLTTVGNGTNTLAGIEYTGAGSGYETGTSVSTAGSFDNMAGAGRLRDDLLIGAPGAFQGGGAYLVYSLQSFAPNMALGTIQSLTSLGIPATTNPVTNPLQGAVFGDQTFGDRLGFAVSSAGDFNADGAGDIILGAPGYNLSAGYADVVFGQTGTTTTRINGIFVLSPTVATAGLKSVSFLGTAAFDYAGYSLATTTHINFATTATATPNFDVLIGAPGGEEAYLVPGTAAGAIQLTGSQQLSTINSTLNGSLFTVSGLSDPSVLPSGFGTSVSARNPVYDANALGTTVDSDAVPDLFFGAPYSSLLNPVNLLTTTRSRAGVAYIFESGLNGSTTGGGGNPTSPGSGGFTNLTANAFGLLTPVVFTGDNYGLPYPAVSSLEHLNSYAPLPVQLAYNQFLPLPGYRTREEVYHHPDKKGNVHQFPAGTALNVAGIGHSEAKVLRVHTLSSHIFDRGKTRVGRATSYTHKVKVIPRSEQKGYYPG